MNGFNEGFDGGFRDEQGKMKMNPMNLFIIYRLIACWANNA